VKKYFIIALLIAFCVPALSVTKLSQYEKPTKSSVKVKKEKKVKVKLDPIPIYSEETLATENVCFPKNGIEITDSVIRIEITSKNYEVIMEDTN
jgi:hypothetical protein